MGETGWGDKGVCNNVDAIDERRVVGEVLLLAWE